MYIDVYEAGTAGCSEGTGTSTGRAVGGYKSSPLNKQLLLNNFVNLEIQGV